MYDLKKYLTFSFYIKINIFHLKYTNKNPTKCVGLVQSRPHHHLIEN